MLRFQSILHPALTAAAILALAPVAAPAAEATNATLLYSFTGGANSASPSGVITPGPANVLYGTTPAGGGSTACIQGCGTVYALNPPATPGAKWTETLLLRLNHTNGVTPSSNVVVGSKGELYGATGAGGKYSAGNFFKLMPPAVAGGAWAYSDLYDFKGGLSAADANGPTALLPSSSGVIYGESFYGGLQGGCTGAGCGAIVTLTSPKAPSTKWTENVIYAFTGGANDGEGPFGGLVTDASGALYGVTYYGGNSTACGPYGCGAAFKLTPPKAPGTTWTETVLYRFAGGTDGASPKGLALDPKTGILYGTTLSGGANNGGTAFTLKPPAIGQTTWAHAVIYSFCAQTNCAEGQGPSAPVLDSTGALYGTTSTGGAGSCLSGCGTVFKLTPPATASGKWTESIVTTLNITNGRLPASPVLLSGGNVLGLSQAGGAKNLGTLFSAPLP